MIIGLVGKANVGKSTFFKAVTQAEILIANYPFATIEPNKGFGFVKIPCVDTEFETQCNPRTGYCIGHERFVPVEVIDVAGLVPGAHQGKGLGLAFLDDLRQADVLIHVVDMAGATNDRGEPVEAGSYDPADDVRFLEVEIDQWFLGILQKGWDRFARQVQQERQDITQAIAKQLSGLKVDEDMVKAAVRTLDLNREKPGDWTEDDLLKLATELRKATKPIVVAANKMDMATASNNLERIKKEFPDLRIIPCSADSELSLKQASKAGLINYVPGEDKFTPAGKLNEKQEQALTFIQDNVLKKFNGTGVQEILNAAVFDELKQIAIFPGGVSKLADQHGNVLPDCFLLNEGSTALDFAAKIHTDLAQHFIRAVDVKTKRTIGKDHVLNHRDVIEIISGK